MTKLQLKKELQKVFDSAFEYAKEYSDDETMSPEDVDRVIIDGVVHAADRIPRE